LAAFLGWENLRKMKTIRLKSIGLIYWSSHPIAESTFSSTCWSRSFASQVHTTTDQSQDLDTPMWTAKTPIISSSKLPLKVFSWSISSVNSSWTTPRKARAHLWETSQRY
jgi:hypothetical protein